MIISPSEAGIRCCYRNVNGALVGNSRYIAEYEDWGLLQYRHQVCRVKVPNFLKMNSELFWRF